MIMGLCIGVVAGMIIFYAMSRIRLIGNLIIADDTRNDSCLYLEISRTDIRNLKHGTIVKLKVIDESDDSQK